MKQTWKQISSLILSVCMVLTMLPMMVFAETGEIKITEQQIPPAMEAVFNAPSPGTLSVTAEATNGSTITYQWFIDYGYIIQGIPGGETYVVPTDLLPGTYTFYCKLNAKGCPEVESNKMVLTIKKETYIGSISDTVFVKANQMISDQEYTLPPLPSNDMSYEVESGENSLVTSTSIIKNNDIYTLIFSTASQPANTVEDIKLKINGDLLYEDSVFTLTVKAVDKTPVNIIGVTGVNNEYSGQPEKGYVGESVTGAYNGDLNHFYKGRNGTVYNSENPPIDTGDYTVTLSIPDDADYSGSADIDFSINKKEVVVKPVDYYIVRGQDLSIADPIIVNYLGFAAGDNADNSISTWAVAQLNVPDSNTPGNSLITFKTEAVLKTEKEKNYTLKHENGTLNIQSGSTITVQSNGHGTASSSLDSAGMGAIITLTSVPDKNYYLKEWQVISGDVIIDNNQFTMGYENVTVKAIFEIMPTGVYNVTVNNGTASPAIASAGEMVTIIANTSPSGKQFKQWTVVSGGVTLANSNAVKTTFTMPASNVTITANWSNKHSEGPSSSGSTTTPTKPTPEKKSDQLVTVSAPVTATAGTDGTASAIISDKTITEAITKAQGKNSTEISIELNVTMPKGAASLTALLTKNSLKSLVNADVISLEISGAPVSLGFDLDALKEIRNQSDGDISINIAPVTELSDEAQALIGNRPVYNITISTINNGETENITDLTNGTATLYIPYIPGQNEAEGYLFGVYVDGNGNASRIKDSAYDADMGGIIIPTWHFSVYGVGYTVPSAKFTDVDTHWGKESIDYVVGRGLLSGTSETTFSPNAYMTRGMLVTALGRLEKVDVKDYTTNSFTDVKVDSGFHPYIEWAYSSGIVQGIDNQQFAPDRAITREEIAVIFQNYAKATDYKLPIIHETTAYADADNIGSIYETAVTAMQQAGIMTGATDNRFNPKSNATRTEVSTMLHRYIKLTINK